MLGLWSTEIVSLAVLAITGFVFILLWYRESKQTKQVARRTQPVRWKNTPADKQLGDLGEIKKAGSLHEYLLQLHDHGRCPVTSFWWGKEQVVSVCSPKAFKDTAKLTDKAVRLQSAYAPLIGLNEDWETRSKCLYHVFKGETLESYFPHFVLIAQEVEKKWLLLKSGERVPLLKTAFSMTIKGISRCIFGNSFEDQVLVDKVSATYMNAWAELETRINEGGDPPKGSKRDLEFEKSRQYLRDIVKGVISRRQEGLGEEHVPFIDSLLQSGIPYDQVISDAIAFMIGGFHTSADFITWMLWYLATHPEVQEQLRKEIERETGGERGDRLRKYAIKVSTTYSTYFRQVQDEALRLSTSATWAVRESSDDIIVDGCFVPRGTPIIHALGVSLHSTTSWKEGKLNTFNPDRFAVHTEHVRRGLEFCPFGIPSRRKCPGYIFAHFEITVILSILLFQFKLIPTPDQVVKPKYGLVTSPKTEIYVLVNAFTQ